MQEKILFHVLKSKKVIKENLKCIELIKLQTSQLCKINRFKGGNSKMFFANANMASQIYT